MNDNDTRKLFGADDPPPDDAYEHMPTERANRDLKANAYDQIVRALYSENAECKRVIEAKTRAITHLQATIDTPHTPLSPDAEAWGNAQALRVLQAENARLTAALDAIIAKIGEVSVSSRSVDYMNAMDEIEQVARDARGGGK